MMGAKKGYNPKKPGRSSHRPLFAFLTEVNSFYGTEASMRLIALLFNIIALFKNIILKDPKPTLRNIRYRILTIDAVLGFRARKKVLKISAPGKLKDHLKSLLNRIYNYHQSQLQCSWIEE